MRGAAGTGKTVLALEAARRASARGARTGLICFNRLLGDWLRAEIGQRDGILVGSYHKVIRDLILGTEYADDFKQFESNAPAAKLYAEGYSYYGQLALSDGDVHLDTLIVDEAQDLLRPESLEFLNALLAGGLAAGVLASGWIFLWF